MKISIIVEKSIEKDVKKILEDIATMIDELSESYPDIIYEEDVEVTVTAI